MRDEIAYALERRKNIIPVLKNCDFPSPESLPAAIAALPSYHALEYSHKYFHACISLLVTLILERDAGDNPSTKLS